MCKGNESRSVGSIIYRYAGVEYIFYTSVRCIFLINTPFNKGPVSTRDFSRNKKCRTGIKTLNILINNAYYKT